MKEFDIVIEVEGGKVINAHTKEEILNVLIIDHDDVKINNNKLLFELDESEKIMIPNVISTEITNFEQLKQKFQKQYTYDNNNRTNSFYRANNGVQNKSEYTGLFDF